MQLKYQSLKINRLGIVRGTEWRLFNLSVKFLVTELTQQGQYNDVKNGVCAGNNSYINKLCKNCHCQIF